MVDYVSEEDNPVIKLAHFDAPGNQPKELPEEIGTAVDVADGECM